MPVSVLMSAGGFVVVLVISIVVSVISSLKKNRRKQASYGHYTPSPKPTIPVEEFTVEEKDTDAGYDTPIVEGEQFQSATSATESFISTSPEYEANAYTTTATTSTTTAATAGNQQSAKPTPVPPLTVTPDDISESEYSLKDPDAAKRAIIYSEILKPKF